MTNPIDIIMVNEGPSIYYDFNFRVVLESHLTYFRNNVTTKSQPIIPNDAYRFEGDLYGLLRRLGISSEYHWLIMRVNDFTSPQETTSELKSILVPDPSAVEKIRQLFMITQVLQ